MEQKYYHGNVIIKIPYDYEKELELLRSKIQFQIECSYMRTFYNSNLILESNRLHIKGKGPTSSITRFISNTTSNDLIKISDSGKIFKF